MERLLKDNEDEDDLQRMMANDRKELEPLNSRQRSKANWAIARRRLLREAPLYHAIPLLKYCSRQEV